MSMASKTNVHGPGSYMMNTGFVLPGFPCMGAWISYGLGSLSDNLPCFVVMPDPRGLPYNNMGNFSSGFPARRSCRHGHPPDGSQPDRGSVSAEGCQVHQRKNRKKTDSRCSIR